MMRKWILSWSFLCEWLKLLSFGSILVASGDDMDPPTLHNICLDILEPTMSTRT